MTGSVRKETTEDTALASACRCVRDQEQRVAEQEAWMAEMQHHGHASPDDEHFLAGMRTALADMKAHVAVLEKLSTNAQDSTASPTTAVPTPGQESK